MKNITLPIRVKRSVAIGLSSALFLVGCGPVSEESALVETNGTTASTTTSFLASAKAVVSQREVTATSECSNGGVEIKAGNDTNGNATLDSNEVVRQWVVCHGTNGQEGAVGQSTHFEINSIAAGGTCPAGGQTIKIGIKEGAGFKAGSTQSFPICNGADGVDNNGQSQVSDLDRKIAKGKALVKNTSVHLDNLINEQAYDTHIDSVDAVFADQNTGGLYAVLGDAVAGALDVLSDSTITDDKAALTIFLKGRGYSDADLENLTVARDGTQLTVAGLASAAQGVTSASLVLEHSTRVDEGDDSVEKWVIRDYLVSNSTHKLNPTEGAKSFVELRLAAGSSSLQAMIENAWEDITYQTNTNSKFAIDLSGVALSNSAGTSFTGDMDFNIDLYQGELDNTLPAFDFNRAHLAGSLWHNRKTFNIDLSARLAPKKNGFIDPSRITDEQRTAIETNLTQFQSALTASGVPIVFDSFERNSATVERLTVDYTSILSQFDDTLRINPDDRFEIVGVDKVVVELERRGVANNSYYSNLVKIEFRDGKEVARNMLYGWVVDDMYQFLASKSYPRVELTAAIYGFEVEVRADFDTSSVSANSSVLPLSTDSWGFYASVDEAGGGTVDIQDITAKIDSDVDGIFDVTLSLKNIKEVSDPRWRSETTAKTSLLFKHNKGELLANFGLRDKPGSSDEGIDRSDINIAFTDLEGAKFVVQFQDRAQGEDFSAYVTVGGINVGKLVKLHNGDYAVEFRDYERVKLINN